MKNKKILNVVFCFSILFGLISCNSVEENPETGNTSVYQSTTTKEEEVNSVEKQKETIKKLAKDGKIEQESIIQTGDIVEIKTKDGKNVKMDTSNLKLKEGVTASQHLAKMSEINLYDLVDNGAILIEIW